MSGPLDIRKRAHMLSGYPGTRWRVRVRPPQFDGYPFVAGTRRAAPLLYCKYCLTVVPSNLSTLNRSATTKRGRARAFVVVGTFELTPSGFEV